MEGVAHVGEAAELLRRLRGHRARIEVAVIRDHADTLAGHAREPRDKRGAEALRHLEEAALVHHRLHHFPHVEGLAPFPRHDVAKRLFRAVARIVRFDVRRALPHIVGQIGKEARDLLQRVLFVLRHIVDNAGARMHFRSAEFLLRQVLVECTGDNFRPRDQHLRVFRHDREMRGDKPCRGHARHRA